MKVVILHHDLEFAEKKMAEVFTQKGCETLLIDVRNAQLLDFEGVDLVLNRVYASVANRDHSAISKALELLQNLEEDGVYCLNSQFTSFYDYSKYQSYLLLDKAGILTPKTILINKEIDLKELIKELVKEVGLPMVIKRDVGGRGKDVSLLKSNEEIMQDLQNKFDLAEKEEYFGGFIAQEFVNSVEDYDCRIGVIHDKVEFAYGRSLISSEEGGSKWLASMSKGSERVDYTPSKEVLELAELTSKLIKAKFNELDIMFSEKGPIIIENNPTPNYFDTLKGNERIETFADKILMSYNEKEI